MLKYNLPKGTIKIKEVVPLIVAALYPEESHDISYHRVEQAIRDGRNAKKNRLPVGNVLTDKVFWEWAVIKWPRLLERIEGIPLYVKVTGFMNGSYAIEVYDTDNPLELDKLVDSFLDRRVPVDQRTKDDVTNLKQAYVMAEYEVNDCRKKQKSLQAENESLKKTVEGRHQTEEDRKKRSGHRGG